MNLEIRTLLEGRTNLTKLCRSVKRFVITIRNEPVVVAVPETETLALVEKFPDSIGW